MSITVSFWGSSASGLSICLSNTICCVLNPLTLIKQFLALIAQARAVSQLQLVSFFMFKIISVIM